MITRALYAVIIALSISTVFLWNRLSSAKEEIGSLRTSIISAADANKSNLKIISVLRKSIDSMISKRTFDKNAASAAVARKEIEIKQARIDLISAERKRDEILKKTTGCKSIATARIDVLCPGIVDRLRIRSFGGDKNKAGNAKG